MPDMTDGPRPGDLEPMPADPLDTMSGAEQLRRMARATHRAMIGWQRVRSEEDWEKIVAESRGE